LLLGLTLGACLALVLALPLFVYLVLESESGKTMLTRFIEDSVRDDNGLSLSLGRLEGSLFDSFTLTSLTLSDPQGVWLEAQDLRLDWSPDALISARRLRIEALSIARLDVARAPDLPPGESDDDQDPFTIPRLPLSVSLESLQLPRIALAAPLLGDAFVLSLSGHFRAPEGGDFSAALDLTRIDGTEGRLQAKASLDPEDEHLTIALSLADAPGGLISQLVEDPSLPALSASIEGAGTLAQWRGRLNAQAEGMAALDGDIDLQLAGQPRLAAKGTAEVGALLEESLRPLVGPRLTYDLQADYDEAEDLIVLPQVALESDSLAVSGTARVALDDSAFAGSFQTKTRDPTAIEGLLAPLGLDAAEATADVALDPQSLALTLKGRLAGVALEDSRADGTDFHLQLAGDPSADAFVAALEGRLDLQGFTSGIAAADGLLGAAPALSLKGRFDSASMGLEIDEATLSAATLSGKVAGDITFDDLAGAFDGSLQLPDLAPFGALGGLALAGDGTLDFQARSDNFADGLDLTLAGRIAALKTPFPEADALLGESVTFSTTLSQQTDGLTVTAFRLQGAHADLQATGALSDAFSQVAGDYDIELPDLSVLSASAGTALTGQLEASGHVAGDLSAPGITGTAGLKDATAEGLSLARLDLDYRLSDLATAPAGRLTLKGESNYGAIAANGSFKLTEDRLTLDPLTLSARQTEIEAEGPLAVLLTSGLVQGRLRGRAADLAQFADLAGGRLGGDLAFTADLSATAEKQAATLQAQATNLLFDDLRVQSAEATLQAADLLGDVNGTASLNAADIAYGGQLLDKLDAKAAGSLDALDFDVTAQGNYYSPFDITAAGRLAVAGDETKVTLAELSGTAIGRPIEMTDSLTFVEGPARRSLSGLALTFGPGSLKGGFEQDAKQVRLDLAYNDMPLDIVRTFDAGLDIDGRLSGTASLSGAATAPKGRLDVTLEDFEMAQGDDAQLPKLGAVAQVTLGAGRLDLSGEVSGFANRSLSLQAAIPATLSLAPFAFDASENAPLSGSLQFNGSAESLAQLFIDPQQRLRGDVTVDLALGGSLAAPVLTGEAALTSGTYENLVTGTTLKALEVSVVADGKDLRFNTLKARTNGSGRIDGEGNLSVDPDRNFPLDLKVKLEKARLVERDDATVAFDGSIALQGDLEKLYLQSKLETTTAELRLISNLPPNVVTIDVIEKNRPASVQRREKPDSAPPVLVVLDVVLSMPGRVFLRGQDIDTEWQGEFKITGTSDKPVIAGTLQPVRGYVSLLGKRFDLQQGSITLDGAEEIDPLLDLEAVHRKTDLIAIVKVKGRLTAPEIILTSQPPLPEDEVISRVLFDKSASALTAAEAVELAAAVARLASGGGGFMSDIRAGLGLDVLSVGAGETGGASLSAGKYLVDGVYVGVDQGTAADSTRAKVEIDLTPTIKLESSAGSDSSKVGVKWKWDY